MGDLDFLKNHR